jgi:transcriptional regulator with XRE-family HTH domain
VIAGELLRDARRRHGLTQRQLAIRARTSQAAISRIERGLVSPSVDTLADLLWMMNEELVLTATPVNWGHDTTLNQSNLKLSLEDRIRQNIVWARRMDEIRGGVARRGG